MSCAALFVMASSDNYDNATLVPSSFHKLCAPSKYTRNANATSIATRSQNWFLCFRTNDAKRSIFILSGLFLRFIRARRRPKTTTAINKPPNNPATKPILRTNHALPLCTTNPLIATGARATVSETRCSPLSKSRASAMRPPAQNPSATTQFRAAHRCQFARAPHRRTDFASPPNPSLFCAN